MMSNRGFTLIELIVVVSFIAVIAAVALPAHIRAQDAAKEEETKACLHTISIALERYATDHSDYPAYILGGDRHGWDRKSGCRAITLSMMDMMQPPRDPLIDCGYLTDYPANPFLDSADGGRSIVFLTGASVDMGDGDIRFGFNGDRMGNSLDDPKCLFEGGWGGSRLQYTMFPIPGAYLGVINHNSPNSFYCMGGYPEWSRNGGGTSETDGTSFNYWWPGEFFYRSAGDFSCRQEPDSKETIEMHIWDWPYTSVTRYMMGAYGSLRTEGLDVIRLTNLEGNAASSQPGAIQGAIDGQYYQDHSNLDREASHPFVNARVIYSNPEVFGGGGPGLMPQFPYYESRPDEWLYGAPDGYPDGIILVITSSCGYIDHREWIE